MQSDAVQHLTILLKFISDFILRTAKQQQTQTLSETESRELKDKYKKIITKLNSIQQKARKLLLLKKKEEKLKDPLAKATPIITIVTILVGKNSRHHLKLFSAWLGFQWNAFHSERELNTIVYYQF